MELYKIARVEELMLTHRMEVEREIREENVETFSLHFLPISIEHTGDDDGIFSVGCCRYL